MTLDLNIEVLARAEIVLGALNSEPRIRILKAMMKYKYRTFSEILRESQPMSDTNLSNHLATLKQAGLITKPTNITPADKRSKVRYTVVMQYTEKAYQYANLLAAICSAEVKNEEEPKLRFKKKKGGPA